MSKYTQHPLSAAFPPLTPDEFASLRDSIADLGVQNAITLFEGQVLDGWNRYCAACELGMECPERELDSWVDPRSFVLAQNKARRHLTVAQMAMAAVSVYEWRGAGRPSANSALSAELKQAEAAEQAGVSVRSLRQADTVKNDAVPEVVEAVKAGDIGLVKASAIAKLPPEQQVEAINKPMREIAPVSQPAPDAPGTSLDMDDSRGIDPVSPPAPAPRAPSSAHRPPAIKEEPAEDQQRVAGLVEETAALREQLRDTQQDLDHYIRIVEQSDPLKEAVKVATEQRTLAQGLQARINSLMTEVAELKRQVSSWKRKAGVTS
jgi:hypothetical protein